MTEIRDLLDHAVEDLHFDGPPAGLYAAAARRRRRALGTRVAGGSAAVAVLAGGGALAVSDGIPGLGGTPAVVAASSAPDCVQQELARLNGLAHSGRYALAVVDIPDTPAGRITQGPVSGRGWEQVTVVQVLSSVSGEEPASSIRLWATDSGHGEPPPGRSLLVLFLDNSPKAPATGYAAPAWIPSLAGPFAVDGDTMQVRCDDGTSATVRWTDAANTWLAASAPSIAAPRSIAPSAPAVETVDPPPPGWPNSPRRG